MSTRHIKLTYLDTGESVIADMLDAEAPETCARIWDLLPVENKMIHGMYSGAEVFMLLGNPPPAADENTLQLPLPGEILYFYEPGKGAVGPGIAGEICVVYGRGVVLRAHEGIPTQASLFARIPGDWRTDWVPFAQACRRCRWEGPRRMRIERA